METRPASTDRPLASASDPVVDPRGWRHRGPCSRVALLPLLVLCALLTSRDVGAQLTLPPHFEIVTLPGSYNLPVGLTFTPDGAIVLIEKPGTVRVLSAEGQEQAVPLLDLVAEVNNDWDRGLLGVALHPGFVADGGPTSWLYLLYTVSPNPPFDNPYNGGGKYSFSRLTRWRVETLAGALVADLASRQVLLGNQLPDGSVPDAIASLHNSHSNGTLRFADDGSLLVATGDGAHYDFQDNGGADNAGFDDLVHPGTGLLGPTPKVQDEGAFRSQDPRSLSGKLLRIDPATGFGYPSNPFFDGDPASNPSRVWALGLRNPFRMHLVPGTGASDPGLGQPNVAVLGDVGWNVWEELNVARFGGENFGWPCYEGNPSVPGYQSFSGGQPGQVTCQTPTQGVLTAPALAWHHSDPSQLQPPGVHVDDQGNPLGGFRGNCAIGGPIYTGGSYPPEFVGRMFVSDYGRAWIRSVEFGPSFEVLAVHNFAGKVGQVVDIERHPITGDLYLCNLAGNVVQRLGYGANLTPVAQATATPTQGSAPLAVQFDGSGSSDPDDDPLGYDWDFGDGTPHDDTVAPQHVYALDDVYTVTLRVTDPLGLSGQDMLQIAVGNAPPVAHIASPIGGQLVSPPVTLTLSGSGDDPEGQPLTYAWSIDLHHGTHVHPGTFQAVGSEASFPIDVSPEDDDLLYYRVRLTVTDPAGLSDTAQAWVYPAANTRDVAGQALPIARVDELAPPGPTGGGNHDVEVVRDGVFPAVGSNDSALQFDTYHGGAQGADDWIGYELAAAPGDEFRFTRLAFQEGKHFVDGGWWESLAVEVRENGVWSAVPDAQIDPPYPFELAAQPFFDGTGFDTYTLRFDPIHGDAIRLRGNPGGSAGFVSAGELRAYGMAAIVPDGHTDISAQGTLIASLFALSPPVSQGGGNPDPTTLVNGTWPPQGSESWHAQWDTFHSAPKNGEEWVGLAFPGTRSFSRLVFQEGRNNVDGGAFVAATVQVQATPGGRWTDVPGQAVAPPYDGLDGVHYETFVFDFPTVAGVAIRLHGAPAGSAEFISVGELAVFTPDPSGGCGWVPYGQPLGANTLSLASPTPPLLGFPVELQGSGTIGAAPGWLGLALGDSGLPVKGGTLLLDPLSLVLLPVNWDAAGTFQLATTLPNDPLLAGQPLWMQAFASSQPAPWAIRLSNGLRMTPCAD